MKFSTKIKSAMTALAAFGMTQAAFAQENADAISSAERVGKPTAGSTWFPPAVGEQAHMAHDLNVGLIWLSFVISIFVVILLVIVVVRFRDTGKEPRRFSHNTPLEIAWTLVPVLILVVVAVFSVPALRAQVIDKPEADVVINVTGSQWYWSYEYPEEGFAFDSFPLEREDLAAYGYQDDEYLFAVDNEVVVPVDKNVTVQVTAADVIHAWKIPAFYVMTDAVPGRVLTQHFRADREGLYFGQCSELCGKQHAYMPIVVRVVSQEEYDAWVASKTGG